MLKPSALVIIVCALGLVIAALGLALGDVGPGGQFEGRTKRTVEAFMPGSEIRRAVYAKDHLWVLTEAGNVWALSPSSSDSRREALPEPAIGLCADQGGPVAVTRPIGADPTLNVRRWTPNGWSLIASLSSQGEPLLSTECPTGQVDLLTSFRLIRDVGGEIRSVNLSRILPDYRRRPVTLTTPETVFIGYDMGEFGGGLFNVDRRTGQVRAVMGDITFGSDCFHQIDPSCDNVTGIASTGRECILVTLTHGSMIDRASATRVCNNRVIPIKFQPCRLHAADIEEQGSSADDCAWRLYDPIRGSAGAVASRPGGLVVFDHKGRITPLPTPPLEARGPFEVSFASPDYVVLQHGDAGSSHPGYYGGAVPFVISR